MNQSVSLALTQGPLPAYPVKLVSKSLPSSRALRLRASWFAIGIAFSLGCNAALMGSSSLTSASVIVPADTELSANTAISDTTAIETVASAQPEPIIPTFEEPTREVRLFAGNDTPVTEQHLAPATTESIQAAEPITASANEQSDAKQYPLKLSLKLENGDTLGTLLGDAGIAADEAHEVVAALRKHFDPRKMAAGKDIEVKIDKHPSDPSKLALQYMNIPMSVTSSLEITRDKNDAFAVKKLEAKVERKLAHAGGKITSSLYETAADAGLPIGLVSSLITAYSYDVDFQRDIKDGDAISVLYEKLQTEKGESAGTGNVVFAELTLGDRKQRIYRFTDSQGSADYYNEKGESVRKGLLRTPINGAKITSRFGMRKHPIMGYSKMHRGVDFGAPTGTPIYAAGDGTVEFVGTKGGYGNYLRLKHNTSYSTAYAHISRFASGIRHGSKVKQGQIIAYVGSTGASTGPHLHYEVMVNGGQVNPANVKFKTGTVLAGKELAAFRRNVEQVKATVATLTKPETKVAQLDTEQLKAAAQ